MNKDKKTILIIDDDNDVRETMKIVLAAEGYDVIMAKDGKTGIEKASDRLPDAIILDVMMNNKTEGFFVAQELRRNEKTKYIPILMITSINKKSDFQYSPDTDGEFLPVDGFIEKPVKRKDLKNEVERILSLKKKEINICGKKSII